MVSLRPKKLAVPLEPFSRERIGVWLQALGALGALLLCLLLPARSQADVKPVRRVLILNELGPASPVIALVDGRIRASLENSPYHIELYIESLETTLFPDPAAQKEFRDWYLHKYQNRKPDVIIAVGPSPLQFLTQSHEKFFPNTPVIFCVSTEEWAGYPTLDSSFTGVWELVDMAKTMDLVLKLEPRTKHVVVVGGVAAYDRANEATIRNGLRDYLRRLDVTYLTDLDMPTLLERIKRLPENTIILHAGVSEDAAGTHYLVASQSTPLIIQAASAPVFAMGDVEMGQGGLGGYMMSFAKEADIVAADVQRILNGEKPQNIPIVRGANVYLFDWRALKRWGLNERNLPPGSILLNRQATFWESYKRYVVSGISLIGLEALLIFALLWQRARRRRAENELVIAYDRLRIAVEAGRFVGWDWDIQAGTNRWFGDLNGMFGIPLEDFAQRHEFQSLVHPADRDLVWKAIENARQSRQPYTAEFRIPRPDGSVRWVIARGKFYYTTNGDAERMLGLAFDITERKQAEEALSSVSRRLIEAHEEERTWIARELHDDFNQRIALLAVNLERLKQDLPASNGRMSRRVKEVQEHVWDLGSGIQALSHRLHSSKLEYLGLAAACDGFCKEFSGQQNVEIDFHSQDIPKDLPQETALCLFRVLQEALQNAAKHSGARQFKVLLKAASNEIQLSVHDSGVGFDVQKAISGPGLGFTSMKERMKLIDGHLSIDLKPQGGTTIYARAPIRPKTMSAGAGG
jgi:PAS domain S-box-containing protein